jgi:hypothetical protein
MLRGCLTQPPARLARQVPGQAAIAGILHHKVEAAAHKDNFVQPDDVGVAHLRQHCHFLLHLLNLADAAEACGVNRLDSHQLVCSSLSSTMFV